MADQDRPEGSEPADPSDNAGRAASGDQAEAREQPPTPGASSEESAKEESAKAPIAPAKEPTSAKADPLFRPSYVFLAVVTILNLAADVWSKQWAKSYFESQKPGGERRIVVIEDLVSIIFAKNRGGAWGLLQNEAEGLRRPFFLVVSVAAIVFIVSLYRKLTPGQRALKWGLPLVLGGALGNLIDRIRFGYVIDFIDVYMRVDGQVKHWPTFNVADIAICVGVGLMAIDMFSPRKDKAKDEAPERTAKDDGTTPEAQGGKSSGEPNKPPTAGGSGDGEREEDRVIARGS
jgi:signal peptidase II